LQVSTRWCGCSIWQCRARPQANPIHNRWNAPN